MRLYRFLNTEYGLRALQDRRLRVSRVEQLNDEFEFIGLALKQKEDRKALKEMRAHLHNKSGIICMSKHWANPLLWGHYADSLRGMALGFEVSSTKFHPVKYVLKRPRLEDIGCESLDDITPNDIKNMMLTKFVAWSYEEECRGFYNLQNGEKIGNETHYFEPFSNQLKLRTVVLGPRSNLTRAELSDALGNLSNTVETFQARTAFQDFSIVKNRNAKLLK